VNNTKLSTNVVVETDSNLRYTYSPEGPAKVEFCACRHRIYTYGHLYKCIEGGPVEIQTPAQWKLIGHIMTALSPPALSLSNVLPPPSSLCVFMHANKNPARFFLIIII
jgi:hypothetical protein